MIVWVQKVYDRVTKPRPRLRRFLGDLALVAVIVSSALLVVGSLTLRDVVHENEQRSKDGETARHRACLTGPIFQDIIAQNDLVTPEQLEFFAYVEKEYGETGDRPCSEIVTDEEAAKLKEVRTP